MLRHISLSLAAVVFVFSACRASFEDIEKQQLVSSQDDLKGKLGSGDEKPNTQDPILQNDRELPREESPKYDCKGVVIIHERGPDRNRDGVLQPTEVSEVTTECRPDLPNGGGKDPGNGGGGSGGTGGGGSGGGGGTTPPKPGNCPNQSGDKSQCPDEPGQNDPSQGSSK
jgi:hypothetical protein